MKTIILTVVISMAAIAFAGCGQSATNSNSSMNHGGMNHNSMNSNSMNMNGMNHNSMNMNSNMNHSNMKSDANAANAPYDLQFIDTMTAHHQGAVEMAKLVDARTQRTELKAFAQKIIADQNKEIEQMKQWREQWFKGAPRAVNMEMPGMADSMKMDMSKLLNSKDKAFDLAFIEMMIPHHAGATTMSKEALQKAQNAELNTLVNNIIKEQEAEIDQMEIWKSEWSK